MANFFTENSDLVFQFNNLNIQEIVAMAEDEYRDCDTYDYAPCDYDDAVENYRKVLEIVGSIAGDLIEPLAAEVDEKGAPSKTEPSHTQRVFRKR